MPNVRRSPPFYNISCYTVAIHRQRAAALQDSQPYRSTDKYYYFGFSLLFDTIENTVDEVLKNSINFCLLTRSAIEQLSFTNFKQSAELLVLLFIIYSKQNLIIFPQRF